MKKKAIWLSYDFGLKGDYSGLYTWLDEKDAVECGHGLAFFTYPKSSINDSNMIDDIITSINKSVSLSKSDRLYIIWREDESQKIKGKFINGGRKQSPWEGYGVLGNLPKDDSGE